ncbi:hypothetical protein L226DRAFT_548538 [Lentinus tigrinus ALCF2SS1-7]|uniref:uncharacterized protein n=1 Tax=Lentinus tigrinus ALCF2SS1-7 TaxID=1328758 RepID=UPI00116604DD|nr:hypothetical protein L226DRAFT_548538 [Lentinus tigrinus ALCF2SS1-7]
MHGSGPAAWDIYAKELWPLRYGHPLWYPEPCPDFGEVRIGDVGYLREGNFTRLFNAMHGADHPLNVVRGVPCGHEVFDPDNLMLKHLPNAITQSHLHSKNIRSTSISAAASANEPGLAATAGLRYQCSETSGALLMLKKPAHRTYIDCSIHIKKYFRTHISSWLDFANGPLGIGLEEKDIVFVSGHTKTSVWAEAAFDQRSSGGELVIAGGCAVPSVGGEFRVSMSHDAAAMVHAREGPADRVAAWRGGVESVEKDDQSIFINYYKMKTRFFRSIVVQGAAGPHELPDDYSDDDLGQSDSAAFPTIQDDDLDILDQARGLKCIPISDSFADGMLSGL